MDAHHHGWDLTVRPQPWTAALPPLQRSFELAELQPSLAAHGIGRTVLVQTVCTPDETPELLALAAGDGPVAGVVGWVDLTAPDVDDRLARLRSLPGGDVLVGVRHQVQQESDPWWLCRPDVRRGLRHLADAGLTYDLVVLPEQLPAAIETVRELADLRFVLDHGGKPDVAGDQLAPWRDLVAELARLPNVAVKLSGLSAQDRPPRWDLDRLAPYARVLLEAFRPARTMYGSDWPVCLLAGTYHDAIAATEAMTSQLSDAERSQVFGGTAQAWYRWHGTG